MRMPVELMSESARPGRGLLLAVLFAMATLGLVLGFDPGEPTDGVIETAAEPAGPQLPTEPASVASITSTTAQASTVLEPRYEPDVGALEGLAPTPKTQTQGVLSAAPKPPPTTAAPVTTAAPAPTTTSTTVADPAPTDPADTTGSTTDTSIDGGPDPSETTVPGTETTETTATTAPAATIPEGYVDAGHGVLIPAVLVRIRRCESTDNYQAANPNSSARGAYQFLTGSWAAYGHAARYGVSQAHLASNAQQDEAALITWQRDGTKPWAASKSCWNT